MKKYKITWKRGCAYLTAIALAAGSINMPVTVARASIQESQQKQDKKLENEIKSTVEDISGMNNNELFERYLNQLFYGVENISTYSLGNFDLSKLETDERDLYNALKDKLTKIGDGEIASTEFTIDSITFTKECTASDTATIEEELKTFLESKITKIVDMLLADCPYELYWFNKTQGYKYSYSYSLAKLENNTYKISNLNFSFNVASDYAKKFEDGTYNPYLVDTEQVTRAKKAKANADAIVAKYAALNDYDKLCAYKSEICELNTYNTDAAGTGSSTTDIDPWQLIYVFDGDKNTNVVCEGYSKAFAYLFEKSTFQKNIKCYIVTGTLQGDSEAAGGHMWNIVTMEDGKNYIVDVTNCDGNSIGNPDMLFLAGLNGSVEDGYTFTRGNQNVSFKYYDKTKELYPQSVLELSNTNYANKKNQEQLEIASIEAKTYGDNSFELSTTGGNGDGVVSYSVPENNGVLSIDGNTASIIGAGKVVITAIKAGDDTYNQATATYELEVSKKSITPSITGTVVKYYDETTSIKEATENTLSINLADLLEKDTGKVEASAEFAFKDTEVGVDKEIIATNIVLSGDAADNYTLSSETVAANVGTIKEAKKAQEQLFVAEITGKVYGDDNFELSTTGGSGDGAVSYSVPENNSVLSIDGNTASIIGAGKVMVTAIKAGDDTYNQATATYELEVSKKSITPSITGTVVKYYDETTSIKEATENTLSINLADLLEKDTGKVEAVAEFAFKDAEIGINKEIVATNIVLSGDAADNYTLSSETVAANVGTIKEAKKAQEQLSITEITGKVYGDNSFELLTTGGSGDGAVSYSVPENNNVLSIDGNTASIIGAGKVMVTAIKAGDDTYNQATATYELEVSKKSITPSITGAIVKYYDKTTSVEKATENTLSINLAGLLEKDTGKVEASAEFAFKDAEVGINKEIIATNIVLSGNAASNYILNIDTVSANVGKIVSSVTDDNTGDSSTGGNTGNNTGSSSTGGNTGSNTGNSSTGGNTGSNTGNSSTGGNTGNNTGSSSTGGNTGNNTGSSSTGGNTGNNTGSSSTGGNTGSNTGSSSTGGNTGNNTGSSSTGGSTGNNTGSSSTDENVPNTSAPISTPAQDTIKTDAIENPDGSITTTVTEIDNAGNTVKVTKTTVIQKDDGTNVKTEIVTSADNKVVTTITTMATDGSAKEAVSETGINSKNKEVKITTTKNINPDGLVTDITKKMIIENIESNTNATITTKISDNKVVTAKASVSKTVNSGNKVTLSKDTTDQIIEATGEVNVKMTMTVKDAAGKVKYKVKADTADLVTGKNLYLYQLNTKTGEYIIADSKTYKVNNTGNIQISIKDNKTYELVSEKKNKAISKAIIKTIAVKKKSVNVKKGNKTNFVLSSKLNSTNVKSITYTSSKKSVVMVSNKGKITAKKSGTTTIKAKVVLKNGAKKTVSMKVKVK